MTCLIVIIQTDDDHDHDDYAECHEICEDPSFLPLLGEADMYNDLLDELQTNNNSIMEQSGCVEILETVSDKIGDANC